MLNDGIVPASEAASIAASYGVSQIIVITFNPSSPAGSRVNVTTYGISDADAGQAAMAGRQLTEVIRRQPPSLRDALEVAHAIRPHDVVGTDEYPDW